MNGARVRDAARLRRACELAAAAAGWQPPLTLATTADDSGAGQTRAAVSAGAELVVAVGGVPLAIVPAGSANLTARAIGIPGRLESALGVAFGGRDRPIDLGSADGVAFVAMAGIGLDAAVVAAAQGLVKRMAGWPAYAVAAAGQLLRRPVTFTIRIDDGEPMTRRAHCVTVGNSGALPGGFPVMPDARLDDGRLDVVVLAPAGLPGWADIGYRIAVGSRRDDAQLERYQARTVEIHAQGPGPGVAAELLPRQLDGEIVEASSTLSVRILPAALLVRVPAASP